MNNLLHQIQHRPRLFAVSAVGTLAVASFASKLYYIPAQQDRFMASSASLSSSLPSEWPIRKYVPKHSTFPYSQEDLTPSDPSSDSTFYSSPRFVTHIDDNSINLLQKYYGSVLPHGTSRSSSTKGDDTVPRILDLCSSWISHYPSSLLQSAQENKVQIAGMGMNEPELARNPLFSAGNEGERRRYCVQDLNQDPNLPSVSWLLAGLKSNFDEKNGDRKKEADEKYDRRGLDATTVTVSIDYLTQPLSVLRSLLERTEPGGTVHLAISNRCFPTKAVSRWLKVDEEQRLGMVGDYLWFAGWREVEILTLSDGTLEEDKEGNSGGGQAGQSGLKELMRRMGMAGGCDPLWVVRARKVGGQEGETSTSGETKV